MNGVAGRPLWYAWPRRRGQSAPALPEPGTALLRIAAQAKRLSGFKDRAGSLRSTLTTQWGVSMTTLPDQPNLRPVEAFPMSQTEDAGPLFVIRDPTGLADGLVTVDMGAPVFVHEQIPFIAPAAARTKGKSG